MRRYTADTLGTARAAAPIVEPQRSDRAAQTLTATAATLLEHAAVAVSWAGVVVAAVLAWEAVALWPLTRWQVAAYGGAVVFLCAFAAWATWHYSQDERLRGRDLREWLQLEHSFAAADLERREALADNERLRLELEQMRGMLARARDASTRLAQSDATTAKGPARAADQVAATVRELARRVDLGLAYDRDAMVAAGYTQGSWGVAMRMLADNGFARQARKRGAPWEITARKAEDILSVLE